MLAVQPKPTSTTSTGGSRVAMSGILHARAIAAEQAHRRHRVALAVLVDFRDVVVARSGKADQLPPGKIAVSTVHRIGEKPLDRVLQQHREEVLRRSARKLDIALLEVMQQLVLFGRIELGERTLAILAAPCIDVGYPRAVELRRRQLELIALFLRALFPRTLHVPGLGAAIGTGELPIDECRDTRFLRTGPQIVVRNQPGYCGFDPREFDGREIGVLAGLGDRRRGVGNETQRYDRRRGRRKCRLEQSSSCGNEIHLVATIMTMIQNGCAKLSDNACKNFPFLADSDPKPRFFPLGEAIRLRVRSPRRSFRNNIVRKTRGMPRPWISQEWKPLLASSKREAFRLPRAG